MNTRKHRCEGLADERTVIPEEENDKVIGPGEEVECVA